MHKVIIVAPIIAAVSIAVLLLPSIVQQTQTPIYDYEVRKITIDNIALDVEIADDSEKIQRGLMFRDMLPENHGMLFIFDEERKYSFWMMNMKFNLDIIWLNADGKVVHIVEGAEPCIDAAHTSQCTFSPDEPARYVLEVNSGFVQKYGIDEGSVMRILT